MELDTPRCLGGLELYGDGVGKALHSEVLLSLQAVADTEEKMEAAKQIDAKNRKVKREKTGEEEMEVDIQIDADEDMEVDREETGEEEMEVDVKEEMEEKMEVDVNVENEEKMEAEMEEYIEHMDIDEKDEEEAMVLG